MSMLRRTFTRSMQNSRRLINILTLELTEGKLPRRAQELVMDWAELHRNELLEDWELCRRHLMPNKIEPLS